MKMACSKNIFMKQLCREHFASFARLKLRQTLAIMYKTSDIAFGSLDPEGHGYISLDSILTSYVSNRCGLAPEEISAFFEMQNIFKNKESQLTYIKFRELFFPHMTLAGEDVLELNKKDRAS